MQSKAHMHPPFPPVRANIPRIMTKEDYMMGFVSLSMPNNETLLRHAFSLLDLDGDGQLDASEIRTYDIESFSCVSMICIYCIVSVVHPEGQSAPS